MNTGGPRFAWTSLRSDLASLGPRFAWTYARTYVWTEGRADGRTNALYVHVRSAGRKENRLAVNHILWPASGLKWITFRVLGPAASLKCISFRVLGPANGFKCVTFWVLGPTIALKCITFWVLGPTADLKGSHSGFSGLPPA